MNIDSIQNGVVIDHIKAGRSMQIYHLLGLDQLECPVALITNAHSGKMGRKDIIKIDSETVDVDLDIIALIDAVVFVDALETVNKYNRQLAILNTRLKHITKN